MRCAARSVIPTASPMSRRIGTQRAQVALALSIYDARNGKHVTASELLGPGVDLSLADAPA
jgi:hypothetical protein